MTKDGCDIGFGVGVVVFFIKHGGVRSVVVVGIKIGGVRNGSRGSSATVCFIDSGIDVGSVGIWSQNIGVV